MNSRPVAGQAVDGLHVVDRGLQVVLLLEGDVAICLVLLRDDVRLPAGGGGCGCKRPGRPCKRARQIFLVWATVGGLNRPGRALTVGGSKALRIVRASSDLRSMP
jgi:hypothetical protein